MEISDSKSNSRSVEKRNHSYRLGITMIFWVTGIINLAMAMFLMIGGMTTWLCQAMAATS